MKQRFLFLVMALFIALGVIAAPANIGNNRNIPIKKHHRLHNAIKKVAAIKVTKSGEVILTEDFSGFTEGSEASPDATDITDFETGEIPDNMTQAPGWIGVGVHQAGGKAYLGYDDYFGDGEETGVIAPPAFEHDGTGTYNVSVKVKSTNTQGDYFTVEWGNLAVEDEWDYLEKEITNSWNTYTFSFSDITEGDFSFLFYASDYECFIDDVQISYEEGTGGGGGNPNVFFFEDCGTTAPDNGTRPAPADYTGWRNYGVDNITFSGASDVRSTSQMDPHVWFSTQNFPRTFEIDGINTSEHQNIKFSFKVAGSGSNVKINEVLSLSCVAGGQTTNITLPATTTGSNTFVDIENLTGIPSAESVKFVFSSSTGGLRLDDFTLEGAGGSVNIDDLVEQKDNKPTFHISGNTLSVRNVALGSTIEIYNVAGQILQTAKYFGGGSVSVGNLPKGVYIIRVNGGSSTKVVK
ncbi:MAG: T9SS type A sorting domain-containing protein [Bacteroidales bacterium]|nr:T9SS type A sorting domain-containing protein [Bacteroidales bacterium]